jgi:hypothetical protein
LSHSLYVFKIKGNGHANIEAGESVVEGAMTAAPPKKEEIEKLLAAAPRYGIEIRLPGD